MLINMALAPTSTEAQMSVQVNLWSDSLALGIITNQAMLCELEWPHRKDIYAADW